MKVSFTTQTYSCTILRQEVDSNQRTTIIYSAAHPRKGTEVCTEEFIEALLKYRQDMQDIRRLMRTKDLRETDYVSADAVLKIYKDIIDHEIENAMSNILDILYR